MASSSQTVNVITISDKFHQIPWKTSIFLWFSYGFPTCKRHCHARHPSSLSSAFGAASSTDKAMLHMSISAGSADAAGCACVRQEHGKTMGESWENHGKVVAYWGPPLGILQPDILWLVVWTPLKNMKIKRDDYYSQLNGKIKVMFQTTNQWENQPSGAQKRWNELLSGNDEHSELYNPQV